MRYDREKVEAVIMRLSTLIDPLALMGWIAKRTKYGDKPGPEAWYYTRRFLADYDREADLPAVVEAFGQVGVEDEVDAQVWLAENMDAIK